MESGEEEMIPFDNLNLTTPARVLALEIWVLLILARCEPTHLILRQADEAFAQIEEDILRDAPPHTADYARQMLAATREALDKIGSRLRLA
jgi:hypothetical protein